MNKKIIIIIICFIASTVKGQEPGIQFTEASGWKEILQKAKKENRYIFLDCYATWCGPCKYMAKEIFTKKEVGDYFNTKFINVKVQMDRTKSDAEDIKKWYGDAKEIESKYSISAYPTYLFFTPEGKVVHRIVATTKTPEDFITKVKDAFDPARQYYTILNEYKNHKNDSVYLRNAIRVALASSDRANAAAIGDYYIACLKNPYAADNLAVIRQVTISSKNKGFDMFLNHSNEVDAIINKGFSEGMISRIMYDEVLKSYFDKDVPAPDWAKLSQEIKKKYPILGDQTIEEYQPAYYRVKRNVPEYEKAILAFMSKYQQNLGDYTLNDYAWTVFSISDNREVMEQALNWSKRSLELVPKTPGSNYVNYIDTYANLLYKLGNKDEAIKWEKSAIEIATNDKKEKIVAVSSATLAKMEKGEKTWD
jgi:thioredoxin-related protein